MIKIPELRGYFGGKCGSGVYQQIINIIPPHHTLVVPFLGHCGITRNLRPCQNWYLNDIDKAVVGAWQLYYFDHQDKFAKSTTFLHWDWRRMLPSTMDNHGVVIYLDPPLYA